MFAFLSKIIGAEVGASILLPLTIIVCTALLEDVTIIVVALLAADEFISVPFALVSLYLGIMLGDLLFYAVGSLIRTHPRLARYVEHDFSAALRSWLDQRYQVTVFSGHFVPGLRSTTYIASGFFRYPLRTYLPAAFAGGFVLEIALFTTAYWFGNLTRFIGPARWIIAILFVILLVLIGRHNLRAYRAQKDRAEPPGGAL
jgi:membrane protein DedA with SNARE-associated domain